MILDYGGGGDCLYWSLLALYDGVVGWSDALGMRERVRAFEQEFRMPVPIAHPTDETNRRGDMHNMRLIIASFFDAHFDFYWNGVVDPTRPYGDRYRPYREEIEAELKRMIRAGYVIDLTDDTAVKNAYVHRILGWTPDGQGHLVGRDLFGTEVEIDIAANVFGARIFVFTKPHRGAWQDARVLQFFVPHLNKPAVVQQWALYNYDQIHYQALMPFRPPEIPAGGPPPPPAAAPPVAAPAPAPAAGGGGKKRVKEEDDEEAKAIKRAIAESLKPEYMGSSGGGSSSTGSTAPPLPNMSGLCLRQ